MAELAQAEVFSLGSAVPATKTARSAKMWQVLVAWVAILFGALLRILRGTPSWAQLLASVGVRSPQIFSSSASSQAYKQIAVDPPTDAPPSFADVTPEPLNKLTVVLDLDETLICAYETCCLPATVRSQAIKAGLNYFDLKCLSSEKDADGRMKVNYVTVFERPGLREFLKQTSEFADLVLFTAGIEGYASPVVDRIDVDNKLAHRLYRSATVSTAHREHVKDLSCVSKDLSRIVIVDNSPFSFLLQPLNGIPCKPFSTEQPWDDQLMRVILPLLKHLSKQKDVRPVLYEKFHMPEWFTQHGVSTTISTL